MSNEMIVQPQEFPIGSVFKNMEYIVPIYQRNYAWTEKEIEQLLNDISDISESFEGKYYLGSLIVNHIGTNQYEVIDGQQRLTTLFLLLSYLKIAFGSKNALRFEAREKSNRTLQEIKEWNQELSKEDWYSNEIIEGYSVIKKYFERKNDDFMDLFMKNLSQVIIIRTQVPKDIDLNHYFEVMNTRGEQLEIHEIVKAKILGAIKSEEGITEQDKKDKLIAATIWDACAQMSQYVQMNIPKAKRDVLFGENWDTFNNSSFDDIRKVWDDSKYIDETRFTLRSKLQNPIVNREGECGNEEGENERFESIISFPNFLLQVNEAMNEIEIEDDKSSGLDDKRFVKLMEVHWKNKENALNFIFSMLKYRYLFDRIIIKSEYSGQHKNEGSWSLKRLEMYNDGKGAKPSYKSTFGKVEEDETEKNGEILGNSRLRLLQSCLRITYTAPKTMHWIARVLKAANNDQDVDKLIRILECYACEKVKAADYKNETGFRIERIVFTYLDYVLAKKYDEYKLFQFQFRTSIEHFFPQNPINGENAVQKENRDSFGNLALITVSANSRFSNMLPIHKVEQYKDVIAQSPKLDRMKKLLDSNKRIWDDTMVAKHNEEMMSILEKEISSHVKL